MKFHRKQFYYLIVVSCLAVVLLLAKYMTSIHATVFSFSVMGDVPRTAEEKAILTEQIVKHNEMSQAKFMIHVGDIKSGSEPCIEQIYQSVAMQLKALDVPTFIVPGDNEWNDCEDPDEAWKFWADTFLNFERNWNYPWKVIHHTTQKENLAFVYQNVLFIGINLVGGLIHSQSEWDEKIAYNLDWIKYCFDKRDVKLAVIFAQASPDEKHASFIQEFREMAKLFGKKILFIHGDGHEWLHMDGWLEPNIVRIQVAKGGIADPLEVSINIDDSKQFAFERNPFNRVKGDE
ncbi:hypothetical protein ACFL46_00065 [Candidatus Neomarinimicrobiota bacterium]